MKKWFFCVLWGLLLLNCKGGNNRGTNIDSASCEGAQDCQCYADSSCDEGLTCSDGVCTDCAEGKRGCPCGAQCDEGLVCDAAGQTCRPPTSCETIGCEWGQYCSENLAGQIECDDAECEPGFLWSNEFSACQPVEGANCEVDSPNSIAADCENLNRFCTELADENGGMFALCGICFQGAVSEGSVCRISDNTSAQCEALDCRGLNQKCDFTSEEVRCGDCLFGYQLQGRECVLIEDNGCSECEEQNRVCDVPGFPPGCGDCLEGFVRDEITGQCRAAEGCELIDCAEGEICLELPEAHCEPDCGENETWDEDAEQCRPRVVCNDLDCEAGTLCVERADGKDAACQGACPLGHGWDIVETVCRPCAGQVQGCDNDGEVGNTGRVIVNNSVDNATCICEPDVGYYPGGGNLPILCDGDGDGWLNDVTWEYFEQSLNNPVYAQLGRTNCSLRSVHDIVLRNEAGEELIIDLTTLPILNGKPLPLYESGKNDGTESNSPHSNYGAASLSPTHLNSLTKACVTSADDYNDNGIKDVEEWDGLDIALGRIESRLNVLTPYYKVYRKFSYFLELYDGWYESVQDENGRRRYRYVIEERSRRTEAENTIPVVYPDAFIPEYSAWYPENAEEPQGADGYWRECIRKTDVLYDETDDYNEGRDPLSRAGGDFSSKEFRARMREDLPPADGAGGNMGQPVIDLQNPWSGLNHHSQFKCVHLAVNEESYAQNRNLREDPQVVFKREGNAHLYRNEDPQNPDAAEELRWNLNVCNYMDGAERAPLSEAASQRNPRFPGIVCGIELTEMADTGVYWAAVGYQNYAQSPAVGSARETAVINALKYERGCINECREFTTAACPIPQEIREAGFEPTEPRFTCDYAGRFQFGELQCGCGFNYGGGTLCDLPCPDMDVSYDARFNIETREGVWMCKRGVSSGGLEVEGNGITIRGFIPTTGTDGTVMRSPDGQYTFTAR